MRADGLSWFPSFSLADFLLGSGGARYRFSFFSPPPYFFTGTSSTDYERRFLCPLGPFPPHPSAELERVDAGAPPLCAVFFFSPSPRAGVVGHGRRDVSPTFSFLVLFRP